MKYLLFTHNDLDGAGCRIIFNYVFRQNGEVVICSNSDIDEKVLNALEGKILDRYNIIYFADICPSAEVLRRLTEYNVRIYDHHVTNMYALGFADEYKTFIARIVSETDGKMESGTSLLADAIIGELVVKFDTPMFHQLVDTIRSYDTYEWKKTNNLEAKKLQTLFHLMGLEAFCEYYENALINYQLKDVSFPMPAPIELIDRAFIPIIENQLKQEQELINDFIEYGTVYPINIKGYNVALVLGVKGGANISELAVQYLNQHPEFDIMGIYMPYYNTISFRCVRNDINIGEEICAPIGGGGHPKAAGVILTDAIENAITAAFSSFLNGEM